VEAKGGFFDFRAPGSGKHIFFSFLSSSGFCALLSPLWFQLGFLVQLERLHGLAEVEKTRQYLAFREKVFPPFSFLSECLSFLTLLIFIQLLPSSKSPRRELTEEDAERLTVKVAEILGRDEVRPLDVFLFVGVNSTPTSIREKKQILKFPGRILHNLDMTSQRLCRTTSLWRLWKFPKGISFYFLFPEVASPRFFFFSLITFLLVSFFHC